MKTTQQQFNSSLFTITSECVSVVVRRNRRRINTPGCEVL